MPNFSKQTTTKVVETPLEGILEIHLPLRLSLPPSLSLLVWSSSYIIHTGM